MAELTIDHVTVAGSDLKAMQARLASIGIPSEYGGPHSNHATEMALTSFPDGSYLELIAIPGGADEQAVAAHYWSKWMRGNAGPCAWAARSKELAAEVARLKRRGDDGQRAGPQRAGASGRSSAGLGGRERRRGTERDVLSLSDSRY